MKGCVAVPLAQSYPATPLSPDDTRIVTPRGTWVHQGYIRGDIRGDIRGKRVH